MIGNLPLVIVLGATATGKTDFAIALAQALNGEIVGADSRQIYRYMDIGTAKPSKAQRAAVPHHLIDVVDPDATLSLAEYQDQAYAAIADIHARDKLPLLVGGTGQYLTAIEEGWSIPRVPPHPDLRAELEAYARAHGEDALHRRLRELDPEYAARTHPNNVRRVVRALEVCLLSGSTMTEQQRKRPRPFRIYRLGLTMPRTELYERANARVLAMMAQGFLPEVEGLLARGYARTLPAMSGLGYLELCQHLLDGLPLADAIARTQYNTHDFIRRQEVWFKGHDNGILWHNSLELHVDDHITALTRWLKES